MEPYPIRTFGLLRKEWRARKWTQWLVVLTALAIPIVARIFDAEFMFDRGHGGMYPFAGMGMMMLLNIALGATFLSGEEYDPARAYLYTLPLSRGAIRRQKLLALAVPAALVMAIGLLWFLSIFMDVAHGPASDIRSEFDFASPDINSAASRWFYTLAIPVCFMLASCIAVLLGAIMQLYCRTFILTLAAAACVAFLLYLVLLAPAIPNVGGPEGHMNPLLAAGAVIRNGVLALAVLWFWLRYLFDRSAIQERGAMARAVLGVIFGAALLEGIVLVCFCNFRELAFIVFGL